MDKIRNLLNKYKEAILYLFFGVLAVIVNLGVYYICAYSFQLTTVISTIISWIISVTFAFITNKIWVFECKSWEKSVLLKEITSFYSCRILTGLLDVTVMFIFVDILYFNDILIKIISNVVVIILNYFASKVFVFNKK